MLHDRGSSSTRDTGFLGGYDLREIPKTGGYQYGFLPPSFFDEVVAAFAAWHVSGKAKLVSRD